MIRAAFRVDASKTIGTGHVMRCLTLAASLKQVDASVSFICREHDGHLCELIEASGFPVARLLLASSDNEWSTDAGLTARTIEQLKLQPNWLIVDHYAMDYKWEGALRTATERIMVIDDIADRKHDCDLLLDQNLVAKMEMRYSNRLPAVCRTLLGPRYALLQPVYAELHDRVVLRKGPIRHLLIYFGGADVENLTGRVLAAVLSAKRPDIVVDVVVAAGHPFADIIRHQVKGMDNVHLHGSLSTLAPLMVKADVAIGASGATTWERLCLGLPALVVSLAENQRPIAEELSKRGLIRWIGHHDLVDDDLIGQHLRDLLSSGVDDTWSGKCVEMVDGRGTKRVRAALAAAILAPLRVREATVHDEALLLDWANDPVTRANALHAAIIPAATHRTWLRARLTNREGCRLYVIESSRGVPVGQVRFERSSDAWEIHFALAPRFRGVGLGRPQLKSALDRFRITETAARLFGRVKAGNLPSRRIFESLGFSASPMPDNTVIYELTP